MSLPPAKLRARPSGPEAPPRAAAETVAPRPRRPAPATVPRPVTRRPRRRWLPVTAALALGLGLGAAGAAYRLMGIPSPTFRQAATQSESPPATASGPRSGPMSHKVMLGLVRSTLGALGNAIETGNYSVLRDLGAPGFREANDAEKLASVFAGQRNSRVDLTGIMFTDPVITIEPRIEATGLMRVAGFFPAGTARYEFDLLYKPLEGRWRLFGISTGVARTEPAQQALADGPPAVARP